MNNRREKNSHWKGGTTIHNGYFKILNPDHPASNYNGYVKRCRLLAEKAIGYLLDPKVIVHHFNDNRLDDRNSNLIICENQIYHLLLHRRKRAFDLSGHANYRPCTYCKRYDDPKNMIQFKRRSAYHKVCRRNWERNRYN